jgi:phosphoribulokinase
MSLKHPVISVTGSSGSGTSTIKHTFQQIFRREGVEAASVTGDAFHRFNREDMTAELARRVEAGDHSFSHFSIEANVLDELETLFRTYGETGTGRVRHYVHDDEDARQYGVPPGNFTEWEAMPEGTDLLFYEGLHGAVAIDGLNIARHVDLKIGVVPVINLEWIQKIHRDKSARGYTTEGVTDTNFQRVPVVDTSNPFVARWIPTPDESVVVIRFRNPRGIDFSYLTSMLAGSWMSRANSIVIPGNKQDLAMQLILTPLINRLADRARRAR